MSTNSLASPDAQSGPVSIEMSAHFEQYLRGQLPYNEFVELSRQMATESLTEGDVEAEEAAKTVGIIVRECELLV